MASELFNTESFITRPFAREDAPRVMVWAVEDAPSFIEGKHLNNAFGARASVERFVSAPSDTILAVEPTKAFSQQADISMTGAIGALNTRTGEVYIDPNYAARPALRQAIGALARPKAA